LRTIFTPLDGSLGEVPPDIENVNPKFKSKITEAKLNNVSVSCALFLFEFITYITTR
jgi:hypothetical protein